MKYYLAIDIGASSGRHIIGYEKDGEILTDEVYRFENGMDNDNGRLIWNSERLYREVVEGIRLAFLKYPVIESLSVDTWGVDYMLFNGDEEILPMYAYRDSRTDESIKKVHEIIDFEKLYSRTGTQFNTFNTIYQLYADKLAGRLEGATDFLMVPEYLMYRLTGVKKKEFTEATTTGLVNAKTLSFDLELCEILGLPKRLFSELCQPGSFVGRLKKEVRDIVNGDLDVVFCPTHDTASAVEAIDMDENSPYISSGTWSLLGVKTKLPITDIASCKADYSNEGGVGYNRYQKNITGMWLVQSLRKELCPDTSYGEIAENAEKSEFCGIFDVNDRSFAAPISMKGAIDEYFKGRNMPTPKTVWDYFNSAYISLAHCYKESIAALEINTGETYPKIYIVGGGAKNGYLNRLTENITGKKVVALPIEATAIGNLKTQMKRR